MYGPAEFIQHLAADDPFVAELYECHMENNRELLLYVLMDELLSEAVDSHLGVADADLDVTTFLRSLDRHYEAADGDARSAVVTSFLLYLPYPHQPGYDIVTRLGPVLSAEFARVRPMG